MIRRYFLFLFLLTLSFIASIPHTLYGYPRVNNVQDMLRSVRSHPDSVVILAVFASFCPPCKEEVPMLNTIHTRFKGKVLIQGLSLDENMSALEAFLQQTKPLYPIALLSPDVIDDIGVNIIPQLFIYKKGVLIKHIVGLAPYEDIIRYIES